MIFEGDRVSGIRLAYIGGGSRGWAWKFMTDLAAEPAMGGTVALYDIDRAAAEANPGHEGTLELHSRGDPGGSPDRGGLRGDLHPSGHL